MKEGTPSSIVKELSKGVDAKIFARLKKHLKELAGTKKKNSSEKKYPWVSSLTDEDILRFYWQAKEWGCEIDGKHVFFQYRSGIVSLGQDYDTLRRIAKACYKDLEIDCRVVFEGDGFSYENKNGYYDYQYKDCAPFDNGRKKIGAYCGLRLDGKNTTVFIVIGKKELDKIAKAGSWDKQTVSKVHKEWEDEMAVKAPLKRALKRLPMLSSSIQKAVDSDNKGYDLDEESISDGIKKEIKEANTSSELSRVYKKHESSLIGTAKEQFITALSERRRDITTEQHGGA